MTKLYSAYISEANNLLVETKILKNGTVYGDEIDPMGVEEVEWQGNEETRKIGHAMRVYAVVDKNNNILNHQIPFYFDKLFANACARLMNKSVTEKIKPYKTKTVYLIYPFTK